MEIPALYPYLPTKLAMVDSHTVGELSASKIPATVISPSASVLLCQVTRVQPLESLSPNAHSKLEMSAHTSTTEDHAQRTISIFSLLLLKRWVDPSRPALEASLTLVFSHLHRLLPHLRLLLLPVKSLLHF